MSAPNRFKAKWHDLDLPPEQILLGVTHAMRELAKRIRRADKRLDPVWIEGEPGSGKDVLARWIHSRSPVATGQFVKVHCPAIPPMLLETELFGHGSDTFIRGLTRRMGRACEASGGSLYLDEVGMLEAGVQQRLLILLRRQYARATPPAEPAGMRLIFSTRRAPSEEEVTGSAPAFLQEFKPVRLTIPPLRERLLDVPSLSEYMADVWGRHYGVRVKPLSKQIVNLMQASVWRGNLRELENVVHRYIVLGCDEAEISAELLGQCDLERLAASPSRAGVPLKQAVEERVKALERNVILHALHNHGWDRKKTAEALGIGRQSLIQKMRRSSILPADARAEDSIPRSQFLN